MILGNLLRTLLGERQKNWDIKLFIAEFAYNTFVNMTTSRNSHEIVYGFRLRQTIELIPIADNYRASESTSAFAFHVHELHKEIIDRIAQSNANYKLRADVRKQIKTLNVGDLWYFRFVLNDFL